MQVWDTQCVGPPSAFHPHCGGTRQAGQRQGLKRGGRHRSRGGPDLHLPRLAGSTPRKGSRVGSFTTTDIMVQCSYYSSDMHHNDVGSYLELYSTGSSRGSHNGTEALDFLMRARGDPLNENFISRLSKKVCVVVLGSLSCSFSSTKDRTEKERERERASFFVCAGHPHIDQRPLTVLQMFWQNPYGGKIYPISAISAVHADKEHEKKLEEQAAHERHRLKLLHKYNMGTACNMRTWCPMLWRS